MANEKRYYVHDRGAGQASGLTRWSAVNTRYWVIDRTIGHAVDEFTTKRSATETAARMNSAAAK